MTVKTTIPVLSKSTAHSPQNNSRDRSKHTTSEEDSPVQRLRGRIQLDDPEQIHQIIFDMSLEPIWYEYHCIMENGIYWCKHLPHDNFWGAGSSKSFGPVYGTHSLWWYIQCNSSHRSERDHTPAPYCRNCTESSHKRGLCRFFLKISPTFHPGRINGMGPGWRYQEHSEP